MPQVTVRLGESTWTRMARSIPISSSGISAKNRSPLFASQSGRGPPRFGADAPRAGLATTAYAGGSE